MAELRHCIGSEKFGMPAHEAPVADFPVQPSRKDGLGRMCKTHCTEYTRALRNASKAATVPAGEGSPVVERIRSAAKAAGAKVTVKKISPAPKPANKGKRAVKAALAKVAAVAPAGTEAELDGALAELEAALPPAEDAILVERRERVKAWRKAELQGTPEVEV